MRLSAIRPVPQARRGCRVRAGSHDTASGTAAHIEGSSPRPCPRSSRARARSRSLPPRRRRARRLEVEAVALSIDRLRKAVGRAPRPATERADEELQLETQRERENEKEWNRFPSTSGPRIQAKTNMTSTTLTTRDGHTQRRYRAAVASAAALAPVGGEVHVVLRIARPVAAPAPPDRLEGAYDRGRHHPLAKR